MKQSGGFVRRCQKLLGRLAQLPVAGLELLLGRAGALLTSAQLSKDAQLLDIAPAAIRRLELVWQRQLRQGAGPLPRLSAEERQIAARIREQTARHNRNNVTRTEAYWEIYSSHPELHWALLAHMVSRNGGWSMTDLRGELLPRLLSRRTTEALFALLERANALIFQDAYPQLLLYRESRRRGRSLAHLLPHFGVSAFMTPVWQQFWTYGESAPLTVALIINEQHYIEQRVVRSPHFQASVLDTLLFKTQGWLQLNPVVFPYETTAGSGTPEPSSDLRKSGGEAGSLRLAGLILENFSNLTERIEFGKKLYALLFGIPAVHRGVVAFAEQTPHTGSRADYWPHLFAATRKTAPEAKFQERLDGGKLRPGAEPLYSPKLARAWPDRKVASAEPGDWFNSLKQTAFLQTIPLPFPFDITADALLGLNAIELAVLAAEALAAGGRAEEARPGDWPQP
ncbi:DUF2515 domain-containing protein [Paenibacillus athensensis]|nr:DUF2515 domain-containing protein [Paenibacillus athensensis]